MGTAGGARGPEAGAEAVAPSLVPALRWYFPPQSGDVWGPRDPRKGLEPWRGCRGDKSGQNLQEPVRCKKPLPMYEPPRFTRHEAFKMIWQYGSKNHEILFMCPNSFISGKLSKEFATNSGENKEASLPWKDSLQYHPQSWKTGNSLKSMRSLQVSYSSTYNRIWYSH